MPRKTHIDKSQARKRVVPKVKRYRLPKFTAVAHVFKVGDTVMMVPRGKRKLREFKVVRTISSN